MDFTLYKMKLLLLLLVKKEKRVKVREGMLISYLHMTRIKED